METKKTIIIVQSVYQKAEQIFNTGEFKVIVAPKEEATLTALVEKEKPLAVVLGTEKYIGPLYEAMPEGGLLARFGVGCDGLDFQQVEKHKLYAGQAGDKSTATGYKLANVYPISIM
jgi:lactate dehydrogenase-like 2-hydroxyacid dehydrogenase